MNETMSLEELINLIVGRIVEPWNLPTYPKEEERVHYQHNRIMWTLKFTIDEQKHYRFELEVRRLGQTDSLALAERLQREFSILSFNMGTHEASFILGLDKDPNDISVEEKRLRESHHYAVLD